MQQVQEYEEEEMDPRSFGRQAMGRSAVGERDFRSAPPQPQSRRGAPPAMEPQRRQAPPAPPQSMMGRRGQPPPEEFEAEEDIAEDNLETDQEPQAEPEPAKKPEKDPQFFTMETNDKGIMTIKLNRGPVNSLNLELLTELNDWLKWIGSNDETKAIVLTSALPMVFSAGLDINELYKPTQRFAQFWTQFQDIWLILNNFPKPIIAAINGNAPAGGCILAICCDYRIMSRSSAAHPEKLYRIGLNETKLGFVAPPWVIGQITYVIGTRKAEKMLQLGETPTADEALAIGLIDQIVDEDKLLSAALQEAEKFASINEQARWMSKDLMRRELFRFMSSPEEREYDTQFFEQILNHPEVMGGIEAYMKKLSKK